MAQQIVDKSPDRETVENAAVAPQSNVPVVKQTANRYEATYGLGRTDGNGYFGQ